MGFLAGAGAGAEAGAAGASTAADVGAGASLTSGVEAYGAGTSAADASAAAGVGGGAGLAGTAGDMASSAWSGIVAQVKKYFSNPDNIKDLAKLLQAHGNLDSTVQGLGTDTKAAYDKLTGSAMGMNAMGAGGGKLAPTGPYLGDISNYQIDPQVAQRALSMMTGGR